MKSKKSLLFIIITLAVLLILSGCSNGNITLSLSPNPVIFNQDQTERELELTVSTEGLGSLSLDNLIVEVIDQNDEVIFDEKKEIDLSSPLIVGGFSDSVTYTLDLKKVFDLSDYDEYLSFSELYSGLLQDKRHTLRITVTGSNNSSLTARIIYN